MLTLVVSLQAMFLSASVMIGQNVTRQPEPAVELPAGAVWTDQAGCGSVDSGWVIDADYGAVGWRK
jgi:hypothetical protein